MIRFVLHKFNDIWVRRSSDALINYYRKQGIRIGDNCIFRSPGTTRIDIMRPSLVSIGEGVDMNVNFTIMAHDFGHRVFVPLFGEFLSSSGEVKIGNNIYFGMNVTVLKGVTIGDNCIIGAGSVVSKSIPANSVAAGVPCKVICTIEEYYEKRKQLWIDEAIIYAKTIRKVENREPSIDDFRPEFGLFVDSSNIDKYDSAPIKNRLGENFERWLRDHKAPFAGFEDFLKHTQDH